MDSFAGRWALVFLVSISLMGCGPGTRSEADRAAEAQAIRNLDVALSEAAQTGDAVAFGTFFAEDAVQMPPDAPPLEGRRAIQESAAGLLGTGADLRFETREVRVSSSSDMAVSIGTWHLSMETPDGPVQDEGSFVEVWQKVGGEWKITADIYNRDLPLGGQ